ncbi:MAG: S-layer homology domain-containing protein [Clostridia bacterium]|nr:S-layer homology domain-containing protein [Clostridia bacterium]
MNKKIVSLILVLALVLSMSSAVFAVSGLTAARFTGVYIDEKAFLMVDSYNKIIWSYTDGGWVKFAGKIGQEDASGEPVGAYADGAADSAYFTSPRDAAAFLNGYAVSDSQANVVRFIENGKVRTLIGAESGLKHPTGLETDSEGNLYVADTGNNRIIRMDKNGSMRVYCAGFASPTGMSYRDGKLYVCETGKNRIIEVDCETETAKVISGTAVPDGEDYMGQFRNGALASARYNHPQGILASADGNIYIADTGNMAIRVISGGRVYTALSCEATHYTMTNPVDIAERGDTIYIADDTSYESLSFNKQAAYGSAVSAASSGFTDIPAGSWYALGAAKAKAYGFVSGLTATTFGGDRPVTRAQYVAMLAGIEKYFDGYAIIDSDATFPDVPGNAWYGSYIRWAADQGYMAGVKADGVTYARPDNVLTREQLVVMLYAFANSNDIAL